MGSDPPLTYWRPVFRLKLSIAFLASEDASYVIGQTLKAGDGLWMW
jgi:hypothetical protein